VLTLNAYTGASNQLWVFQPYNVQPTTTATTVTPISPPMQMVTARTDGTDNVPCHTAPDATATITRRLPAQGQEVTIIATATSAAGNQWYETDQGDWIVYNYLSDATQPTTDATTATPSTPTASGGWTDWTSPSTPPAGTTQTQTQYQTRQQEYTTVNTPTLSGWTYTGQSVTVCGPWSDWTTTPIQSSDTVQVQTQTVTQTTSTTHYNYYHYTYTKNGQLYTTYSSNPGSGIVPAFASLQTTSPLPYYNTFSGYDAYGSSSGFWFRVDCGHKSAPGGSFVTQDATGTVNITEYRSSTISGNWTFWRWGDWSAWTAGTPPTATDTMQVNVQYRYYIGK